MSECDCPKCQVRYGTRPVTTTGNVGPTQPSHAAGDQKYLAILDELKDLHVRKAADYGRGEDPLANLRAAEQVGIPAWKATWLRAMDKVHRINTYCLKGTLTNEGVEDSFKDLSAYAALALRLFREEMLIGEMGDQH